MPILNKTTYGYWQKTKLASEQTGSPGAPGADGADGADGRDGGTGVFDQAKVDFLSVAWADSAVVEDFTSFSGLTVSDEAAFTATVSGLEFAAVSGVYTITSDAFVDMYPYDRTVRDPVGYTGNTLSTLPTVDTLLDYSGSYPRDYTVRVTQSGFYDSAECIIIRNEDSAIIGSGLSISQDTWIVAEENVKFKWSENDLEFTENDTWIIKARTKTIRHMLGYWSKTSGDAAISLEVSLTGGSNWIPLNLTNGQQYTEETAWTNTYSGDDVKWRLTLDGTEASIQSLILYLGDYDKFEYW